MGAVLGAGRDVRCKEGQRPRLWDTGLELDRIWVQAGINWTTTDSIMEATSGETPLSTGTNDIVTR